MSDSLELWYTPGGAVAFIDLLWLRLPAPPQGVLVGAMHMHGDRGQIVVSVSDPQVRQLLVLPGQVLVAIDPTNAGTWSVVDGPTTHLRLPR